MVPTHPRKRNPRSFVRKVSLELFHRKVDSLGSTEAAKENRRETPSADTRPRAARRASSQSTLRAQNCRQKLRRARPASDYAACGMSSRGTRTRLLRHRARKKVPLLLPMWLPAPSEKQPDPNLFSNQNPIYSQV